MGKLKMNGSHPKTPTFTSNHYFLYFCKLKKHIYGKH